MIYGVVICKGKSLLVDIASKKVKKNEKKLKQQFSLKMIKIHILKH